MQERRPLSDVPPLPQRKGNKTEQAMYFLKTVKKGSEHRLVPLKHQMIDGEPVDTTMNVRASHSMREAYPLGTVFATLSLIPSGSHYSAQRIFPMVPAGELADSAHTPSAEMVDAYQSFQMRYGIETDFDSRGKTSVFSSPASLFDEVPPAEPASAPAPAAAPSPKLSFLERIRRDYPVPSIDATGFYVDRSSWQILVRNILRRTNTLLTGPTGVGKTEIVRMIGRLLGMEVSVFDMGSMYDPTVQLLGSHRLVSGSSVFDYAPFAKAVQKPGIILLDELSRAPISTNNLLFPCLDSRRTLAVEQAGSTETTKIAVHPDCVFIATANIGSEYTGTQELDAALTNRFFNVELGYMPSDREVQVLRKRCGISEDDARNIVSVAGTIRSLYSKGELSTGISTRETLAVASLVADGFTPAEALELVVLPQFEGTRTEGERSVVRKCFMAA